LTIGSPVPNVGIMGITRFFVGSQGLPGATTKGEAGRMNGQRGKREPRGFTERELDILRDA